MFWKRMPYWAKGAIIFGILFGPIMLLNETTQFLLFPLAVIWEVFGFRFLSGFINSGLHGAGILFDPNLMAKMILVAVYVLFGAFLGGVVGFLKKAWRNYGTPIR